MAEVTISPFDAPQMVVDCAAAELVSARHRIARLGLVALAKELATLEDRLRGTRFVLVTDVSKPAHLAAVLTAWVPD
jgi:hypothetical protein